MKYPIIILFLCIYSNSISQTLNIIIGGKTDPIPLPAVNIDIVVSETAWCVDDDGNAYRTVKIGNQTWMAENLNVGSMIPGKRDQVNNNIIEKYCYDDQLSNCALYGGLYQWNEMLKYEIKPGIRGICPKGWHLPTDNEWKILEMAVGMSKSEADDIEYRGSTEATELKIGGSTGFDAIKGGGRDTDGSFIYLGFHGYYWTSSENILTHAWGRYFVNGFPQVYRSRDNRKHGFSIRCVKD